jgi:hypothetical protein
MTEMRNEPLSTEQLANMRTDEASEPAQFEQDEPTQFQQDQPAQFQQDGQEQRAQLLEPDDRETMTTKWREIQADFVDHPRQAMQDADALVAGLMQQLAKMFADERAGLEAQWSRGDDVSTEDLRVSLQRYRAFFERLLAV